MGKTKQWLCIAALTLALAPAAWADEPNSLATFIDDLIAQIVAQVTGSTVDEIGIHVPVGGTPADIGIHVPVNGAQAGAPDPGGQPEIGIHVPIGG
jgi:hypothetical protein